MAISLQSTFGSAFIGLVISAILYGVTVLQTYLYYRNYPEDSKILKWMVGILWILDTAHLALCTVAVYWVLVLNYNNPAVLGTTTWSMNIQTDFNGLIGLIAESFYARRVWIVSRNVLLTTVIVILSIIHFVFGIVFTVGSFQTLKENAASLVWITSVGLGSAAAADMLIGVSLCYYLSRNRTGIARTDSLITTLMKYSLTTGFLTGIIACLVVFTFGILPNTYVYVAFFWLSGKCYVNSVLAALNSRESLRERAHPPAGSFLDLTPPISTPRWTTQPSRPPLAVMVQTGVLAQANYKLSPPSPSPASSKPPSASCPF